ncbi:urease accessory protein UreF [Nonomuraea deserti]|uniref:urease accessory protein UreF n=1 Tax=Nonomuraea deserti TaxID=1848322 RepID=UPI0015F2C469|nr:urease accessory UreF family protein [Nonomuraea deserti]
MHPALLLLTDSRLPAGGHAHSGGTEQAVTSGAVHDVPSLARFLRGRLHTAGALAAALAAAACAQAAGTPPATAPPHRHLTGEAGKAEKTWDADKTCKADATHEADETGDADAREARGDADPWVLLDREVDARTASPAQRDASRTQGRLLLRVARRVWPSPVLDELARAVPHPHHPVALGVAAHAAGAAPEDAALAAAYHAVSGPATAAVRLLGLDPVAVHGLLADLTPALRTVATAACLTVTTQHPDPAHPQPGLAHPQPHPENAHGYPDLTDAPPQPDPTGDSVRPDLAAAPAAQLGNVQVRWAALPAYSAPALDLLAEQHARAEIRLFVS